MALPYATEDQLRQLKTQLANVGNKLVKTKEELDALKGTDGQLVYCQGDSKLYIFKKDKWEEVGSDSVGKKVGHVELDAEQSRAFLANDSNRFELTESQIDTVINNDIIKITFSHTEEGETIKSTLDFFKQLHNMSAGTVSVTYHCLYAAVNNTVITLQVGKFGDELTSELSQIYSAVPCTDEDNGKVLQVKFGQAQWSNLLFTEDKTISFLGNHNILVPRNSTDTSILPCTTADNGKVLSVVNGEAQWASGGGELSGDALMNATKDSTTITRTLDTDGKVKFDAKGGTIKLSSLNEFSSGISAGPTIRAGSYSLYQGGTLYVRTREYDNNKIGFVTIDSYMFNNSGIYGPTIYQPEGDTGPTFLLTVSGGTNHLYSRWSISISYQCIKAGTLTKNYVIFYDINYTLGQPE